MRNATHFMIAAALVATSASASATTAPSGIAGPDAEMAQNATDQATVNGLAPNEDVTTNGAPAMLEDPAATDALVTPETGEGGGGFPWGVLGLLGLAGLIGRFSSRS